MELTPAVFEDVRALIEQARRKAYAAVNAELVALYWKIGQRIRTEILTDGRADYGEAVLESLSQQLTQEFGRGFSPSNLRHFVKLAETFADRENVYALRRELSWTHLRTLIYLDDEVKRQFYLEMCRIERWNTRVLRAKIDGMLFERTAISRKPEALISAAYFGKDRVHGAGRQGSLRAAGAGFHARAAHRARGVGSTGLQLHESRSVVRGGSKVVPVYFKNEEKRPCKRGRPSRYLKPICVTLCIR